MEWDYVEMMGFVAGILVLIWAFIPARREKTKPTNDFKPCKCCYRLTSRLHYVPYVGYGFCGDCTMEIMRRAMR